MMKNEHKQQHNKDFVEGWGQIAIFSAEVINLQDSCGGRLK